MKLANAVFLEAKALWRPGLRHQESFIEAAMKLYHLAAKHGGPEQQAFLAEILLNESLPNIYDFKGGYKWMLTAARNGSSGAQYWIARQLATGEGVHRNANQAAKWYRKAAAKLPEAQYNLGLMYFEGDGVRRNVSKARELVLASAKRGEILAAMLLADAYATGELGFRPDKNKARFWRMKVKATLSEGDKRIALSHWPKKKGRRSNK